MTWITWRLYGKAIERAASRARLTSSGPMMRPETPAMPLLFSEAICAPDRLTRADVISNPEVRSALSLAASTARATPSKLTTPPFFIPSDGTIPTPMTRRRDSSSSWPTRAQTLVVPTSTPTKMTSSEPIIALRSLLPVVGRRRVFHAHQLRNDPPLRQNLGDLPVHFHFEDHVPALAEGGLPASDRVDEAVAVLGVVLQSLPLRSLCQKGAGRPQLLRVDDGGQRVPLDVQARLLGRYPDQVVQLAVLQEGDPVGAEPPHLAGVIPLDHRAPLVDLELDLVRGSEEG